MTGKNRLLSILSDAEQFALYGMPDFDDGQRLEYLSLCEAELALAIKQDPFCKFIQPCSGEFLFSILR